MATPWNFDYTKLTTVEKYNIRPTYVYTGLNIPSNSNLITGFSNAQLTVLSVGQSILCSGVTGFDLRSVTSIDYIEKTVTFGGNPIVTGQLSKEFTFSANPGDFTSILVPLSGQQVHDNFFYLAEGLTNHQERVTVIESLPKIAAETASGYIKYNGYQELEGALYGGSELLLIPAGDIGSSVTITSGIPQVFHVAIDEGITTLGTDSAFYEVSLDSNTHTYTLQEFCDYANDKLNNNGSGGVNDFSFLSTTNMSSGNAFITTPYNVADWSTLPYTPGFYIRFNDCEDSELVKIEVPVKPTTIENLVSMLTTEFGAKTFGGIAISTKITASVDNSQGYKSLILLGNEDKAQNGATRIEIIDIVGQSFIEDVLCLIESSIFNFSNSFQFIPYSSTKIAIAGIDPATKILFKDDGTFPGLVFMGYNPNQFLGTSPVYHVAKPSHTNYTLNYDGIFSTSKILTTDLVTTTATIADLVTSDFATSDLIVVGNAHFSSGTFIVTDTTAEFNAITATTLTASGLTTLSNDLEVTGNSTFTKVYFDDTTSSVTQNDLAIYYGTMIDSGDALVSLQYPTSPNDLTKYLQYNGNFGAFNVGVAGTLKIYGQSVRDGCFYAGTTNPSASTRLNYNGNFYATNVNTTSSREMKTNIVDTLSDALKILVDTKIVDYNFKTNLDLPKIGFIAEDTNPLLSTPEKNAMDITNCIGLLIKAVQQLNELIIK